tara:strand:+ start:260 stop:775 length:516 start_codon:yes stop_codon:yes gene_type:complete
MFKNLILISISSLFLLSCAAFKPEKVDTRKTPVNAEERARKNIEEGRGVSLKGLIGGGSTNYEFSTSNPLWRASLEILDFLPLSTVDYSGGMIITDWYTENNSNESIKITIRFLGSKVRTENVKVVVHKKVCVKQNSCEISLISKGKIKEELHSSILRKAANLEKESKNKK